MFPLFIPTDTWICQVYTLLLLSIYEKHSYSYNIVMICWRFGSTEYFPCHSQNSQSGTQSLVASEKFCQLLKEKKKYLMQFILSYLLLRVVFVMAFYHFCTENNVIPSSGSRLLKLKEEPIPDPQSLNLERTPDCKVDAQ